MLIRSDWTVRLVIALFAVVLAPVVEELVFRGILFPALRDAGWPRAAMAVASLGFGLIHGNAAAFLPLSALGGFLAWLYLRTGNLWAPILAHFALKFGPAEFFAVQLLTFCSFVGMSKEPPAKTIAAMMLGFALAAVGMDTVTGQLRLTFGFTELLQGFDFLIAVIGLFGIGEILLTLEEGLAFKGTNARIDPRVVLQTWRELPRYAMTSARSAAVGCFMGIVPGGATPASFMSYGIAKRISKDGDSFGKGHIEGVVAPETAAQLDDRRGQVFVFQTHDPLRKLPAHGRHFPSLHKKRCAAACRQAITP
mgnify:CR=1 FL=1